MDRFFFIIHQKLEEKTKFSTFARGNGIDSPLPRVDVLIKKKKKKKKLFNLI